MKAQVVLFQKVFHENSAKIFFALSENNLIHFNLSDKQTNLSLAKNFVRHEKFEWAINKNLFTRFLFEYIDNTNPLPSQLNLFSQNWNLEWDLFPKSSKKLLISKDKNFLQLAVQYISAGGIDESVIAADYDEAFIKTLQNALEKKN